MEDRFYFFCSDDSRFALKHSGEDACGIPDNDTIVLTGGQAHNFATRWKDILMSFTMFRGVGSYQNILLTVCFTSLI